MTINPLELNAEQREQIFNGEDIEGFDYDVVKEDDWEDEGKYAYMTLIFVHNEETYGFGVGRTGSYYSHYEFDFDDKVQKYKEVEIVKTEWQPIKE